LGRGNKLLKIYRNQAILVDQAQSYATPNRIYPTINKNWWQ